MRIFTLIFMLVSTACLLALAQAPPQSIALSADEASQAAAAKTAVEQAYAAKDDAWKFACETDVRNAVGASQALGYIHNVQLKIQAAEATKAGLLWKHRSAHGCNDCDYAPDGKALVKPDSSPSLTNVPKP